MVNVIEFDNNNNCCIILTSSIKGINKMLILTRNAGESIIIGDNIKIKILNVNAGQVSIGIEAPRAVSVHREEIYQRIKNEGVK